MTFGIIFLVIFIALAFEYINGFHDTANSIATIIGTKVSLHARPSCWRLSQTERCIAGHRRGQDLLIRAGGPEIHRR